MTYESDEKPSIIKLVDKIRNLIIETSLSKKEKHNE